MSYFSDHYRSYVPPHISGTERVRITIMKPTHTQEMEQRIRMRYAFAMSSFGRMFTPSKISFDMRALCNEWSQLEDQPPTGDLYQVDRYFLDIWKTRNEYQEET
mgnify:FL=1|jgi:hypothetical protein